MAHAELVRVDPAAAGRLARGAVEVRLHFSAGVALVRNGARVRSPEGLPQDARVEIRGSDVLVRFSAREAGTYTLAYRVIDDDTHISRGVLPVNIERATRDADSVAAGQSAFASRLSRTLEASAHWLHFVGYAAVFGAAAFAFLLRRRSASLYYSTGMRAGILAMLAADALAILAQTAALEPRHLFDLDTIGDIGASSFGRLVGLDAAGALLIWAIAPLLASSTGLARSILLADGIVLAFIAARMGHALRGLPWETSAILGALHVGAMAVWLGALASPLRSERGGARIAGLAIAISIASGLALAFGHLAGWEDVVRTGYGAILGLKIPIVACAVVVGFAAQRRNYASGWLRGEWAAIALVLVAAAALLTLTPPR